jgi:CRISPR-associated endonuclease/helicase Cas3
MRTLVEQTASEAKKWIEALAGKGLIQGDPPKVHILMGGEDVEQWDLYPERDAILIGTQDMLLSRALNRGYAAGRARWPKDFALLNNDCLWIFDEVQLMSTGFATSLQLQAWRESADMKPGLNTISWWMSATLEKAWLASSIDLAHAIDPMWKVSAEQTRLLWEEDPKAASDSAKRLAELLQPSTKRFHAKAEAEMKPDKEADYIDQVAKAVKNWMTKHGGKALVIMNTVPRACSLAEKLKDKAPLLLHSRFRHRERKSWPEQLKSSPFIIATQVVEAGVDISSRVLFTELCPWPSFMQRCGRAARNPGEKAYVYWLDVSKEPLPYPDEELAAAKAELLKLTDVSLAAFRTHRDGISDDLADQLLPYSPRFVPQSKDLLELFDTTPDLTGADIDVSRYIRDGKEHDISVFWRDCSAIKKGRNPPKHKRWRPEHAELCPVPVWSADTGFRDFAQKASGRIWRWDYHNGWVPLIRGDAERIFPGQVFLLEKNCGGYDPLKGWTGRAEDQNFEIGPWNQAVAQPEAPDEDHDNPMGSGDENESSEALSNSGIKGAWRTILHHSREVCEELSDCLTTLIPDSKTDEDARVVLLLAARLHDWGKAHASFKDKVDRVELNEAHADVPDGLPAKAPDHCWKRGKPQHQPNSTPEEDRDHRRAGFRHELASALAILELLRRHQPDHPSLAWPSAELRSKFQHSPVVADETLAEDALAKEIAAFTVPQLNLLLYLVAAHHGKVRLSLRSSPDDLREDVPWPCPAEMRQARGVREGDALPTVALPGQDFKKHSTQAPAITLHLDVMDLGLSSAYGPSWRERMDSLLAAHGPFRLAWYEAVLRIADQRASKRAETNEATH